MRLFRLNNCMLISVLLCLSACGSGDSEERQKTPFELVEISPVEASYTRQQVLDVAVQKYLAFAKRANPAAGYPISAPDESQNWTQSSLRWSSGFFPGILWQLANFTQDPELAEQARRWTLPLAETAGWDVHDVGFLIDNSFGKGGRMLRTAEFDNVRKQAVDTLLSRFNATVGATRSWNHDTDFVVIIDNMMNLALLFDAARTFGDEAYYLAALSHAQTTAREFVRSDGSSFHVVDFDASTGEARRKRTAQGASKNSAWARGQAWGIYGFALAFKETGDEINLQTAKNMANFYLNNLPEDKVPLWDFDAEGQNQPKDSSAAAIAATGLWLLGTQVDSSEGETYKNASRELVNALLNDAYLVIDADKDVLLRHATGNKPGDFEVDMPLIYADYYLLEAILLQEEILAWPL